MLVWCNRKELLLITLFSPNLFANSFVANRLSAMPCTYLDPEIVHRIEAKEVKTIVDISSDAGLNAIKLNLHYKCPVFTVAVNLYHAQAIERNVALYPGINVIPTAWLQSKNKMQKTQIDINNVDMLCIDISTELKILQNFLTFFTNIKYIIISNKALSCAIKTFLKTNGFVSFCDGFDLTNSVLFINEKIHNHYTRLQSQLIDNLSLIDSVDNDISSKLIYAAFKNNHASFNHLSFKDDINYQDRNGNTALMVAVAYGHSYPLRKLMQQHNLDFSRKNNAGNTALMISVLARRPEITDLILSDPKGLATVSMVNNFGMDVEEMAKLMRAFEFVDLIHTKKYGEVKTSQCTMLEYPQHIIPGKVIICGTCKDVALYLPHTIQIMEKMGRLFEDYRVIISENNSQDDTKIILKDWMKKNKKIFAYMSNLAKTDLNKIVVNTHDDGTYFKVDLIAHGRNIVLDKAMASRFDSYPYLIMMDMDFKCAPPPQSIIEIFRSRQDWDAVFAYGVGTNNIYWDWYALRDYNEPLGPELVGSDWFTQKKWSLDKTDQWCQVYSAFGGCGIYKRNSIRGCRYSSTITADMEKLYKKVIAAGQCTGHPAILKYLNNVARMPTKIVIPSLHTHLPCIKNPNIGVVLQKETDALTWRMNSFVYQYPAVADHIPFHASMIMRGHKKLFINPRFIFKYER